MEELKNQIVELLKEGMVATLSTVDGEQPMCHPVVYASDGAVVYITTNKTSRKVQNIKKNPKVGYSVFRSAMNWNETLSVQMEGLATVIEDESEFGKAMGLLAEKFPQMKDMPRNPNSAVLKIEPKHAQLCDYSKGFGHIDKVDF